MSCRIKYKNYHVSMHSKLFRYQKQYLVSNIFYSSDFGFILNAYKLSFVRLDNNYFTVR